MNDPIFPIADVGGASSSRCVPPIINVTIQNVEATVGIDKGKKVLECEFPILGDILNIEVETQGVSLNINENAKNVPCDGSSKNKNKKKKEKKKYKKKGN